MNLKEVFDQALAQCTEFKNSMDNARQEFEKYVNEIIAPIVENNVYFDNVRCYVGYGRDNDPRIAMIQNGSTATKYLNVPGLTFKLKLERGQKHHSYYSDWYEYRVKAYTDIHIQGLNDETSAEFFDTKDIIELIQYVYDTDSYVQENNAAKIQYNLFANNTDTKYAQLMTNLTDALNEFKNLDEDTRKYISDKIYDETELRIREW